MIDEAFVVRVDRALMQQGVPVHARPFHVVMTYLRETNTACDIVNNPYWSVVNATYAKFYEPEALHVPSVMVGGVAFGDRFYTARVNLGYGTVRVAPLECIDIDRSRLDQIWNADPDAVWRAMYSVADLWDFGYATTDVSGGEAAQLLSNARDSIEASAQALRAGVGLEATVQSSCLAAELSMKGALTILGWDDGKRKKASHNLPLLANALVGEKPGPSDGRLLSAVAAFPNYVDSRYANSGLTRTQLNELALRAQFVAADATRRISQRDLVSKMQGNIPSRGFP